MKTSRCLHGMYMERSTPNKSLKEEKKKKRCENQRQFNMRRDLNMDSREQKER